MKQLKTEFALDEPLYILQKSSDSGIYRVICKVKVPQRTL